MVYLKGAFVPSTAIVCIVGVIMTAISVSAGSMKFAYKKPISDKKYALQEKQRCRSKIDFNRAELPETSSTLTTTTTTTTATSPTRAPALIRIVTLDNASEDLDTNSNESTRNDALSNDNKQNGEVDGVVSETEFTHNTENTLQKVEETITTPSMSTEENVAAPLLATTSCSSTNSYSPDLESGSSVMSNNSTVPCTCGVFLSTQFKRGTGKQPKSDAVIMNELDRAYPCNSAGLQMCRRKCLETMVPHLPNSASILCASLNRDCRKERAYLFIKNCRNHWHETNLTAGREYCCRKGKPYPCPMI